MVEIPSARNDLQRSKMIRNSLGVNYETVALPAELRRRKAGKTLHPAAVHTSALQRQHECLANFPQRNALGSLT